MCFSTIFLFLCNKIVHSTGIICYISVFSVSFYKLNQILPHKIPNITPYIIMENSIFATENSKCVVKRLSSSFTYTKKNKTLEFNRDIEIPMFFLYTKLKHIIM